jgi:hypothetical protein
MRVGQRRGGISRGGDVAHERRERALRHEHHRRVDDVLRRRAHVRLREELRQRHDGGRVVRGVATELRDVDIARAALLAAERRLDVEHRLNPGLVAHGGRDLAAGIEPAEQLRGRRRQSRARPGF